MGLGPLKLKGFLITCRHTTVGRNPLDERSARRRDFYLTTQNSRKRQASMSSAEFEPAIPANDRQQTHALDRSSTGIGSAFYYSVENSPPWKTNDRSSNKLPPFYECSLTCLSGHKKVCKKQLWPYWGYYTGTCLESEDNHEPLQAG